MYECLKKLDPKSNELLFELLQWSIIVRWFDAVADDKYRRRRIKLGMQIEETWYNITGNPDVKDITFELGDEIKCVEHEKEHKDDISDTEVNIAKEYYEN